MTTKPAASSADLSSLNPLEQLIVRLRDAFREAATADTGPARRHFERLNLMVSSRLNEAEELVKTGLVADVAEHIKTSIDAAFAIVEDDIEHAKKNNPAVEKVAEELEQRIMLVSLDLVSDGLKDLNQSMERLSETLRKGAKEFSAPLPPPPPRGIHVLSVNFSGKKFIPPQA